MKRLRRAETGRGWSTIAVGLLALAVIVVIGHRLIETGYENGINTSDGGIFATIGLGLLHGHLPYASYFDHKLPGIYFIDAFIFLILPATPWSLHLADTVEGLLLVVGFYWAVRPICERPAAGVAALFFGYIATLPSLNQMGNLTETYWLLPMVIASGFFLRYMGNEIGPELLVVGKQEPATAPASKESGPYSRRAINPLGTGFFLGIATLCAPQAVLMLALCVGTIALPLLRSMGVTFLPKNKKLSREIEDSIPVQPRLLLDLAMVIGAWFVVVVPVLVWLALNAGISRFWEQIWTYNRVYASAVTVSNLGPYFRANEGVWIPAIGIWVCLFALLVLANRQISSPLRTFLWLNLLLSIAGSAADKHFYPHDILLSVPAGGLVLAAVIGWFWSARKSMTVPRLGATGALIALTLGLGLEAIPHDSVAAAKDASRLRLSTSTANFSRPAVIVGEHPYPILSVLGLTLEMTPVPATGHQLAGVRIDQLTKPGQRIYLFSPEGGYYFVTNRPPASRFIFDSPLIDTFGSAYSNAYNSIADRRELLSDLSRNKPALIAVRAFNRSPAAVRAFPQFARYLCSGYRLREYYQGFLMYVPGKATASDRKCLAAFGI